MKILNRVERIVNSELGMNMTTAFNIFVRQAVWQRKIPFEISLDIPNTETIATMEEANKICRDPNAKRYSNFEELIAEIQNEVMSKLVSK